MVGHDAAGAPGIIPTTMERKGIARAEKAKPQAIARGFVCG